MFGKKLLTLSFSSLLISACGGDGGNSSPTALVGVFEDSLVSGLYFETKSRSGTTNTSGEYTYLSGETITFSVGDVILGSASAGALITPLDLVAGATNATNQQVTNIVRLLLTLDSDGNPDNGISISTTTTMALRNQTVDFTVPDLATEPGMIALLSALPDSPVLVDATAAQIHFAATLAAQETMVWGANSWGSASWQSNTQ